MPAVLFSKVIVGLYIVCIEGNDKLCLSLTWGSSNLRRTEALSQAHLGGSEVKEPGRTLRNQTSVIFLLTFRINRKIAPTGCFNLEGLKIKEKSCENQISGIPRGDAVPL